MLDGIGHIAGIVDNSKLLMDQRCAESQYSIESYQWDPNPNLIREKPKHDRSSHMADAIRYALYSFVTVTSSF